MKSAKISAVRSTIWWTVPNLEDTSLFLTFLVPASDTVNPIIEQTDVEVKIVKGLFPLRDSMQGSLSVCVLHLEMSCDELGGAPDEFGRGF